MRNTGRNLSTGCITSPISNSVFDGISQGQDWCTRAFDTETPPGTQGGLDGPTDYRLSLPQRTTSAWKYLPEQMYRSLKADVASALRNVRVAVNQAQKRPHVIDGILVVDTCLMFGRNVYQ